MALGPHNNFGLMLGDEYVPDPDEDEFIENDHDGEFQDEWDIEGGEDYYDDGDDEYYEGEDDETENAMLDNQIDAKEAREIVETFWNKRDVDHLNGKMTYAIQISKDWRQVIDSGACHAAFNKIVDPYWISSMCFATIRNKKIADAYWNWITDKEISPWRKIIQELEPLFDKNGARIAWIIPGSVLNDNPFNLVKNFAIATRVLTEHSGHIEFWYDLVQKGVPPADAMYLCTYYSSKLGCIDYQTDVYGGWHWPIDASQYHNQRAFRAGKYVPRYGINDGWNGGGIRADDPIVKKNFTPLTALPQVGKKVKTKFSSIQRIDQKEILDYYKRWSNDLEAR